MGKISIICISCSRIINIKWPFKNEKIFSNNCKICSDSFCLQQSKHKTEQTIMEPDFLPYGSKCDGFYLLKGAFRFTKNLYTKNDVTVPIFYVTKKLKKTYSCEGLLKLEDIQKFVNYKYK